MDYLLRVLQSLLKSENEQLRDVLEERENQLESTKNESFILQKRLEKAENDMIKHFEAVNQSKSKLSDEIKD